MPSGQVNLRDYSLIIEKERRHIRIVPAAVQGDEIHLVTILFSTANASNDIYDRENSALRISYPIAAFDTIYQVLRTERHLFVSWWTTADEPFLAPPVSFELTTMAEPAVGVSLGGPGSVPIFRFRGPGGHPIIDNALIKFLVELLQDPDKLQSMKSDPQRVVKEAGLSADQIALLANSPNNGISGALREWGVNQDVIDVLDHRVGNG